MECESQLSEYTHLPQEEDIGPQDRSYQLQEKILEYQNRKILYLISETSSVTFFCDRSSTPHLGSIIVPGYIVSWQSKKNYQGLLVSEVEPIQDKKAQGEVIGILQKEHISNITFW